MTAWHDGRLMAFDTETTGTDPEEARIVQAHLAHVGGGHEPIHRSFLIDPGIPIPEGATAVHGITTERVRADGQPAPSAVGLLAFAMTQAIRQGLPVVIFNARYDVTVLDRECRRHGLEPPPWQDARIIDPHVLDKWADRFRRGSRRLQAVCEHYGVEWTGEAHEAGADALMAARLAWRMAKRSDLVQGRHPEIVQRRALWKAVRDDLDALHAYQATWAREQAIGLRDYFTAKGKHEEAATVVGDWPLVPLSAAVE
jgi:DNA polymerase-3 subunit epsilon